MIKSSTMIKDTNKLFDRVEEGIDYFDSGRLEELKSDDKTYIHAFIDYMVYLEKEVDKLTKKTKLCLNHT